MTKLVLFTFLAMINSLSVSAETYESVCRKTNQEDTNLSLYNCTKEETNTSLRLLTRFSSELGKKQCSHLEMSLRQGRISETDFMVFDNDRKVARSLSCYCQEKMGKGICSDKEKFKQKIEMLNEPFKVKAWGTFLKDMFKKSARGGNGCSEVVLKEIGSNEGCVDELDLIHTKSRKHADSLGFIGKSKEIFSSDSTKQLFSKLKNVSKNKENFVFEPVSQYFSNENSSSFVKEYLKNDSNLLFGLKTNDYEKKLKELKLDNHIDEFTKLLRSNDFEESLRQNYKGGIDFFKLTNENESVDIARRITLASHPDLNWLFPGIKEFSNSDRKEQTRKLRNFSKIAKDNEFSTLRELRLKYEKEFGSSCEMLKKQAVEICKMTSSQNLAIAKELSESNKIGDVIGIVNEANNDFKELEKLIDEVNCYQFPRGYQAEDSNVFNLVSRSLDPKDSFPRGVQSAKIESEVETAINQVEGLESIAERIEQAKISGDEPEKVEQLETRFSNYLKKLEMPNGNYFNYPAGSDAAKAVASYKEEVYDWADKAIDNRISSIQSESDEIINSNLPAAEKKRKLERLLDEVHRLNNGDFLEEIHQEKRKISEYIKDYEDKKNKWEKEYGEEAKKNPEAVKAVAPSRKSSSTTSGSANNRRAGVMNAGSGAVASAASSSSGGSSAYIPAKPSVPFAQGSMLTRIIPKDEFKNKTVKANLLAKHKGFPIAVLDEKALKVELYTPEEGTSYKLQETLTISEAEARGYVFPEDIKKLVASYQKDKKKGRAPASFIEYEPTEKELANKKKKLEKLQSLSDVMERQGVSRRARVVRLNSILDNI